jgi:hypothetical protein
VSLSRDEWEPRDPALDKWSPRRDPDLDRRLGRLGYLPSSGYHAPGCAVGSFPKAPCTCDRIVARESRRRRSRRGGLLAR